jgi:hypothetical protein
VEMESEAERKLRDGLQRKVDEHRARYAPHLAHADRVARATECGEVVGVFMAEVGGTIPTSAYAVGLLPVAAAPLAIAASLAGVPGSGFVLVALPFITGAWFVRSLLHAREPRRTVWLYAFTGGFIVFDPHTDATPVHWSDVTEVRDVWSTVFNLDGESSRALTAYELHLTDDRICEVSRSYDNVLDPYRDVGPILTTLAPASLGKFMPKLPTVDDVITRYAGRPTPGA